MSVTIAGLDAVLRDLRALRVEQVARAVETVLREIGQDAARYPDPPPGSRYRRTFTLRDGWLDARPVVRVTGDTLLGTLTNGTAYGPFVMGLGEQARVHRGRWRTTDDLADAWEDRVAARIEEALA